MRFVMIVAKVSLIIILDISRRALGTTDSTRLLPSASMRASNGGINGGPSNNMNAVSTSASAQQETNQQHSPNDSGISLAEGDLLGVLVDSGVNKAAGARED